MEREVKRSGNAEAAEVDQVFAVFVDQEIPDPEGEVGSVDFDSFGGEI